MDKERRVQVDGVIRDKILAKQESHIKGLEYLETEYGLDLDTYTEVYGESSIDGSSKEAVALATKWGALLESLRSQPFTVMVRTWSDLRPGCYGFGADAVYDMQAEVILVKGQADIIGSVDEDDWALLQISGPEVYRLDGQAFVQDPTQTLMHGFNYHAAFIGSSEHSRVMEPDTKILSVAEIEELYRHFETICSGDRGTLLMRLYTALETVSEIDLPN